MSEEDQVLSVLDAIALNSKASQRDLSRTTGLNLAKVNYLLRKLAGKGFVKLRNVSKNPNKLGYLYILTPHGLAEKSRLTVRFAARTWNQYSKTIERFKNSIDRLLETGAHQVLLLGATEVADMVLEAAVDVNDIIIVGIVDPSSAGETRRGIPVVADAQKIEFDRAIPCDHTEIALDELAAKTGINAERLWLV